MNTARDAAADARLAGTPAPLAYLPWLLSYPLRGHAPAVIVLLVGFLWIGTRTLLGIPMLGIAVIWSVLYLLAVIEDSARGRGSPPPLRADVVYLGGMRVLRALWLPTLLATAVWSLHAEGRIAAALLVVLLAALWLPSYFLVMATEDRLAAALNPLRLLRTLLVLGWPYLALSAGLSLLGAGWTLLAHWPLWAWAAAAAYGLVMAGHAIGYLAYHRAAALDLDVHVAEPGQVAREQAQSERLHALLERIETALRHYDAEAALRALESEPGGPADPLRFHEDVYVRLCQRGHAALIHAQGRRLITRLLNARRPGRALEVWESSLNRHSGFEPASTLELEALARHALAQGQYAVFERLLHRLEDRYGDDPVVLSLRLLQAQDCAERCGDESRARALLQPLLNCTQHPHHARVLALHRVLSRPPPVAAPAPPVRAPD